MGFLFHPADDHQGLAKVALGVARRMGQGHEHLLRPAAMLPHIVLDDGVLAAEPMLVPLSRWKIRWAVWRCFLGRLRSSTRIWSMTPVKGSS